MASTLLKHGFLSIGSNVGDRLANLQLAVDLLGETNAPTGEPHTGQSKYMGTDSVTLISPELQTTSTTPSISILATSAVYETAPVGEILEQRNFYNACLKIATELNPEELLDLCKTIEHRLGRDLDGLRHGPRPIDIDLLLLGEDEYRSERLVLPHREVTNRRFVLIPLLELDPDIVVPGHGRASDYLDSLDEEDQRVSRVAPPLSFQSSTQVNA